MSGRVWTVGHWVRPRDEFAALLAGEHVTQVLDIRSFPGSRKSPQYNREALWRWLSDMGVWYSHLPELGGRRRRQPVNPSINAGWENPSFRNYADYTTTLDYRLGIERLESLAAGKRTALLCGEPMPWRCHRLLVANTLTARGWTVEHIVDAEKVQTHQLGMWGAAPRLELDRSVTYPGELELFDCDGDPVSPGLRVEGLG